MSPLYIKECSLAYFMKDFSKISEILLYTSDVYLIYIQYSTVQYNLNRITQFSYMHCNHLQHQMLLKMHQNINLNNKYSKTRSGSFSLYSVLVPYFT
jgi:hypothetical protein